MKSLRVFIFFILLLSPACNQPEKTFRGNAEPDSRSAALWWPAQRNVWTPLGWRDHMFRFNLVYNGTLVADPVPVNRELTRRWPDRAASSRFSRLLTPRQSRIPAESHTS